MKVFWYCNLHQGTSNLVHQIPLKRLLFSGWTTCWRRCSDCCLLHPQVSFSTVTMTISRFSCWRPTGPPGSSCRLLRMTFLIVVTKFRQIAWIAAYQWTRSFRKIVFTVVKNRICHFTLEILKRYNVQRGLLQESKCYILCCSDCSLLGFKQPWWHIWEHSSIHIVWLRALQISFPKPVNWAALILFYFYLVSVLGLMDSPAMWLGEHPQANIGDFFIDLVWDVFSVSTLPT